MLIISSWFSRRTCLTTRHGPLTDDGHVEHPSSAGFLQGHHWLAEVLVVLEARPEAHHPPVLPVGHTEGVAVLVQGQAVGHVEGRGRRALAVCCTVEQEVILRLLFFLS